MIIRAAGLARRGRPYRPRKARPGEAGRGGAGSLSPTKEGGGGEPEEWFYRVRQVVVHLGSVDKNLGNSPVLLGQ